MNTIIATTDFSEVSDNAVEYACHIAALTGSRLIVLHSFIVPVTFSDTPMPMIPVDESRQVAEDRMNQIAEVLSQRFPELTMQFKTMYGEIVDCIKELMEETPPPLMIVMGNNTEDELPLWMGSNLLSALKNLPYTVMGVPVHAKYRTPENVCLACDARVAEDLPVSALSNLVASLNVRLHVLHVDSRKDTDDMPNELIKLHESLADLHPEFHYQSQDDIDKGIVDFVEEKKMDWLIVTPHKHSLFESLFHKSHTKAVMRKMHVPLVAIHKQ